MNLDNSDTNNKEDLCFDGSTKRKDIVISEEDSSKRLKLDDSSSRLIHHDTNKKKPKYIKRFRSRSLPIINYNNNNNNNQKSIPPLPPINLQSLKEIDLNEILKNPQLRHDILFDPQLQFRPNLDGERGKRKKSIIDKYWSEINGECSQFFNSSINSQIQINFSTNNSEGSTIIGGNNSRVNLVTVSAPVSSRPIKINRLPILFITLRDVLISLLPNKDKQLVLDVMDIDLLIQQLNHGQFDFIQMSLWLGDIFKLHCAPMRDLWIQEMIEKFRLAYKLNSVDYLVSGLRYIFQILEAMKLDVANHQIRILRPILVETAIDFEKDYFSSLLLSKKININDSLNWFYQNYQKKSWDSPKICLFSSIIDLLSCRKMSSEFPSTLIFDHTRLILLRADVRQLVCIQLCLILFKQLIINFKKDVKLNNPQNLSKIQAEILSIVTDQNGNIKWTKNINLIVLQLIKNLHNQDTLSTELPQNMIEFSYNWLIKHIQPNSKVYELMELKIFKDLLLEVCRNLLENTMTKREKGHNFDLKSIANRIEILGKFHYQVFGNYYEDFIKQQQQIK
jgi:hypothetical protein